ncbi:dTDP-4-dehydrorhamnose reductase [candidate division KSB1 bacterium]|nr:dTDP-4-dehydrorhamnose reductase [candidate division KSB1 bacterium]
MRVWVTGCNGLLGQKLLETIPGGFHCVGIDLQERAILADRCEYVRLDLSDRNEVKDLALGDKPDWIIHTAAFTRVDAAETERDACWQANVIGTENVAYAARKAHSRVLHVSTDYIFDGADGPYKEDDKPNPIGFYGRSKLASENALIISEVEHVVVRLMVLYGLTMDQKPNFVIWLLDQLGENKPVNIVNDQYGNTTLADELAEAMWTCVERQARGVYHIAGPDIINRYQFAQMIADRFDLDKNLISPLSTKELAQPAPRPLKSGLVVDKARNDLGIQLSATDNALMRFKKQWDARK